MAHYWVRRPLPGICLVTNAQYQYLLLLFTYFCIIQFTQMSGFCQVVNKRLP